MIETPANVANGLAQQSGPIGRQVPTSDSNSDHRSIALDPRLDCAIRIILENHTPYPAVARTMSGNIIKANAPAAILLGTENVSNFNDAPKPGRQSWMQDNWAQLTTQTSRPNLDVAPLELHLKFGALILLLSATPLTFEQDGTGPEAGISIDHFFPLNDLTAQFFSKHRH